MNCHVCKCTVPKSSLKYRLVQPKFTGKYIKHHLTNEKGDILYKFVVVDSVFILLCGHSICLDCSAKHYPVRNKHVVCCQSKDPFMSSYFLEEKVGCIVKNGKEINHWKMVDVEYNINYQYRRIIRTPWDVLHLIMEKLFS